MLASSAYIIATPCAIVSLSSPAAGKQESPHDCEGFSKLPLVDAFRTLCVAPTLEMKVVFEKLEAVAA